MKKVRRTRDLLGGTGFFWLVVHFNRGSAADNRASGPDNRASGISMGR